MDYPIPFKQQQIRLQHLCRIVVSNLKKAKKTKKNWDFGNRSEQLNVLLIFLIFIVGWCQDKRVDDLKAKLSQRDSIITSLIAPRSISGKVNQDSPEKGEPRKDTGNIVKPKKDSSNVKKPPVLTNTMTLKKDS